MKLPDNIAASEQRILLRSRMLAQRLLIEERMNPAATPESGFPRSMTMRLLTQHPQLAAGAVAGAASLLIGSGLARRTSLILTIARIIQIAAVARRA